SGFAHAAIDCAPGGPESASSGRSIGRAHPEKQPACHARGALSEANKDKYGGVTRGEPGKVALSGPYIFLSEEQRFLLRRPGECAARPGSAPGARVAGPQPGGR